MLFQTVSAIVAVYFSCVTFNGPKQWSKYIALMGGIGWLIYLLLVEPYGPYLATYGSGLMIAFTSHLFARFFKAPVTIFFIPGFFPLVPGAGMYRTAYWYIQNDSVKGQYYLLSVLGVAGMIALSIFTVDSLFKIYSHFQKKRL